MKKKLAIVFGCLAVIAAAVFGILLGRAYYDRKKPNFSGLFELYVYPDMTPEAVLDSILSTGKVIKHNSLKRAFDRRKASESIVVGHYTLDSTMPSMYASSMLHLGWQTPVNLTLSGAIRSKEILARKISSQMLADSADVASFALSADSLSKYGVDTTTLFCHIIPDTYQMYWTASVREIFDRLINAGDDYWTSERVAKAKAQGLTPEEASILASIVDGETRYVPEQPTIAGVYLNRLHLGMKLQADPTVAYCYGYTLNRILKRHLEIDSPYNTYMYAGLPPGPISCPPKSCLEAVLNPDGHNYLYFCADPSFNGSHRFAATYSEHMNNARAFQAALSEKLRNK